MRSLLFLALLASCARADASDPVCQVVQRARPLPRVLKETSGIAASRTHPGVYWTHNDSGNSATLYAVRASGQLAAALDVTGAKNRDWEDIAVGPCPAGSCVYLADTGDNAGKHHDVSIYRFHEPALDARRTAPAERFRFRYPEGPLDAEALFVLPDGTPYVVTKGRESSVGVYRVPLTGDDGKHAPQARRVALLAASRRQYADLVTAADATPSGRFVALRTYSSLAIYRAEDLVNGRTTPLRAMDLSSVGQLQGEAVSLADDGTVVLTAEGGKKQGPPTIAVLRCPLGAAPGAQP